MKSVANFILLSFFTFIASVSVAQIPNAGFETWTSVGFPSYQNPTGWGNLNGSTFLGGIGALTCERGSGGDVHGGTYSMKLTSKSILGLGDAPGITVTGNINTNTQEFEGGFVYTQRPDFLAGWYKYSPQPGDNAEIRVTFWKRTAGVKEEIGEGVILPNTAVSTFTRFLVPITYTSANAPDSARINLISTNTNNIQIGSSLIIDDLEFISCSGFSVSLSPTDESSQGAADGAVNATVTGGTPNYTYSWDNSATSEDISGLATGNYCVTVTDNNGCTVSECALVSSPSCSSFWVNVTDTDLSTVGGNDGIVYADAMNGTAPYSYNWDTPDTFGLEAGTYCVTVTDAAGCVATGCVDLTDPDCSAFYITTEGTDASSGSAIDGTASVTPNDGFAPFQYSWSNSATDSSLTNLAPGQYCVTVADDIGCTASDCVTIGPDCAGLTVSVTATDESLAGADDGAAVATASGGTSPLAFVWSNTATTDSIGGLSDGVYCVTVSDANSCTATACDTVDAGGVGIFTIEEAGVRIFPNPAQHIVTIELSNQEAFRFRLFDAKGKMVKEEMLSSKTNAISMGELPSGNYVVELQQAATGKSYSGKLLKE